MTQGPHYAHAQRINSVLKVYGDFLLGASSAGVWYGHGNSSEHFELPQASAVAAVNNTGAGPSFEFLVGQFQLKLTARSAAAAAASKAGEIAVLIHNQDHAATLLASLSFRRGVPQPPCGSVKELDPSTGQLAPAWDDAPNSPGFQLLLGAGTARLLVLPRTALTTLLKSDDIEAAEALNGRAVRLSKRKFLQTMCCRIGGSHLKARSTTAPCRGTAWVGEICFRTPMLSGFRTAKSVLTMASPGRSSDLVRNCDCMSPSAARTRRRWRRWERADRQHHGVFVLKSDDATQLNGNADTTTETAQLRSPAPVLDTVIPEHIGVELGEVLTLTGSFNVHTNSAKQLCKFFPAIGTWNGRRANTVWNTPASPNLHIPLGTGPIGALYANMTLLNSTHAQCASPGGSDVPQPGPNCEGCNAFPVVEGPGFLSVSHDGGALDTIFFFDLPILCRNTAK